MVEEVGTTENIDPIEQLYITSASPAFGLVEFRKCIELLVNIARLRELERISVNGIGPVYAWTTGEDPDMAMLIPERRAELEKLIEGLSNE